MCTYVFIFTHDILKILLDAQCTTHDIYEAESCDFFSSALGDSRENAKKAAHSASKKQAHFFSFFSFLTIMLAGDCQKKKLPIRRPRRRKRHIYFFSFLLFLLFPFFPRISTTQRLLMCRDEGTGILFSFCFHSLRKKHSHRPFVSHCRCTATHCQLTATRYNELQPTAMNCNALPTHCQFIATCCHSLQRTATHCISVHLPATPDQLTATGKQEPAARRQLVQLVVAEE